MNNSFSKNWLRFSFINLLIVASLGVLMRYKIGFAFPHFDQKHLQHAHSHFAFAGWVAHTLYTLMIIFLRKQGIESVKKYAILIALNLLSAYGMLIAFGMYGYNAISITFSTLSVLVGYTFSFYFIKDLQKLKGNPAAPWFKAGLIFNILSSVGTFTLAYMMATRSIVQDMYLASVYYYLHFQYNGFFLFCCFGLIVSQMNLSEHNAKQVGKVFAWMAVACVPAYFLSTLWLKLPILVYVLVVAAALLQFFAWAKFLGLLLKNKELLTIPKSFKFFFVLVAISMTAKILLQLGSVIPQVSKLAFGFRNIVIAYLHLILLAVITGFLLNYVYAFVLKNQPKKVLSGLWIFTAGVYLNELILGIIGIASFTYTFIPHGNESLFGAAVIMLSGLVLLAFFSRRYDENHLPKP